jgi:hypothetical protein
MAMIMARHVRQRGMMVKGAKREFRRTDSAARDASKCSSPGSPAARILEPPANPIQGSAEKHGPEGIR